jgi:hypothetical protein
VNEELPFLSRLLVAAAAGAAGFALTAALILLVGPFEGWSFFAAFVAAPAALIALTPFSIRILCFALGLMAMLGASFLDVRGADNPLSVFPLLAACLAAASVVAEVSVRAAIHWLRPAVPAEP